MRRRISSAAIFQSWWLGYLVALAAAGLMSVLIGLAESYRHVANISMLYLIVVLAIAARFGRYPAILASVAAFLIFDWFFIDPLYTLTISDPAEWVTLLLFLLTAVITGQLAAGLRRRAEIAAQREREAIVLYDVVRLMSEPDVDNALQALAGRLQHDLELAAVAIELTDDSVTTARAAVGEDYALDLVRRTTRSATQLLTGGPTPTAARRGGPGRWIRIVPPHLPGVSLASTTDRLLVIPVKAMDRKAGRIVTVRRAGSASLTAAEDRLLSAAATQLGLALERLWLQREATENEILRRADEVKNALLNAVSHDLRTPLASIVASAASLRQREVQWTEDERLGLAEAIEEEALRLNRIVGNLLDLSRIEGGSLRPQKDWYDVGTLVDEVLGRLRPLTVHHRVTVSIPEDLPPVRLDYVELDQVVSNLIENAVKHTKPGTAIRVAARRGDGEVQIEVADRGPGIPETALPHLFEAFYRVESRGSRPQGSGLGLAVARGLVDAHGGRIWAENCAEGGARFVFTLPLTELSEGGSTMGELPL